MTEMATSPHSVLRPEEEPQTRPRFRRAGLFVFAALVLTMLAGGWYLLSGRPDAPAAERRAPALTVTTISPRRTVWPTALNASGPIAPWQEASVGTQVGGYQLVEVRVNVGDQVRRGQVLARLDPALLRADETQLVAANDEAQANRERALALQRDGAISDQDVLQAVTAAKTAAAQLAAKRLQLRYTNVVAPDDGVISSRAATLGAVMPAGEELFRLIRGGRLEWRGELTATQLASVAKGQQVGLVLPDGSSATARVRDTAPMLDSRSRLAMVYADILPGSRARAGMYANGQIEMSQAPALVLPGESVVIRDGRTYVVKLADQTATPRIALQPVALGRRRGDEVEIVRGLAGTEIIVRAGAGFLNDGDVVRVVGTRADRSNTPPGEETAR